MNLRSAQKKQTELELRLDKPEHKLSSNFISSTHELWIQFPSIAEIRVIIIL